MIPQTDVIDIEADWRDRAATTEDVAVDFRRFVNGLAEIDRLFNLWRTRIPVNGRDFRTPIDAAEAMRQSTAFQSRYDEPPDIWPQMGWYYAASCVGAPPWPDAVDAQSLVSLHVGVTANMPWSNRISIRISNVRFSAGSVWPTTELRRLVKLIVATWSPRAVSVLPAGYDRPFVADPKSGSGGRLLEPKIGWISYLHPDFATKARLPDGMTIEALPEGGMIVSISEDPIAPRDPEQLRKMRAFEAAMRPLQS